MSHEPELIHYVSVVRALILLIFLVSVRCGACRRDASKSARLCLFRVVCAVAAGWLGAVNTGDVVFCADSTFVVLIGRFEFFVRFLAVSVCNRCAFCIVDRLQLFELFPVHCSVRDTKT